VVAKGPFVSTSMKNAAQVMTLFALTNLYLVRRSLLAIQEKSARQLTTA